MQLIESVELSGSVAFYVQILGDRSVISFSTRGLGANYSQWMTIKELKDIKKAINDILKESKK